jgi:hypothetical protein
LQHVHKAAVTVLASGLAWFAASGYSAPVAQGAAFHKLDLKQATTKVAKRAVLAVEAVGGHQGLDIDPDGEGIRNEVRVTCRRTGDHAARCPWHVLAYVGGETEVAALACSGIARVRLAGRIQRFDRGSDPYYELNQCFF